MLIWLDEGPGRVAALDGIVRASDIERVSDAAAYRRETERQRDEILQAARKEAAAMLEQAHSDATAMLQDAQEQVEQAVADGFERGQREAIAAWHERAARHAIDKAQALDRMHEQLAGIVTSAVRRIVETEPLEALFERAMRGVKGLTRGATTLALRVNSDDYQAARAAVSAVDSTDLHGVSVEVVTDAALARGSCVFESELGILDASLQVQLDGLRTAMERAVGRSLSSSAQEAIQADSPGDDDGAYADDGVSVARGIYVADEADDDAEADDTDETDDADEADDDDYDDNWNDDDQDSFDEDDEGAEDFDDLEDDEHEDDPEA